MRWIGLAYLGVFVVGLAAFKAQMDPTEASDQPVAVVHAAAMLPELPSPAILYPVADTPNSTPIEMEVAEAEGQRAFAPRAEILASSTEPASSNPRRRSRNRYPGPIPTPDEWHPPEGPVKIALQAGHWRADEAPAELSGLRGNGTRWQHVAEWEANLEIAKRSAELLEEIGYEVEILPAVVPPGYRAHLFISIHADGSGDARASGFRAASPRFDATGRAAGIVSLLEESYGEATGLTRLPTVTRRMQNYYAFNFRRYEHALHPMTIAVILETGFLTSARDRLVILDEPDRAARGIVAAVTRFSYTPPPTAVGGH